MVFQVNLLIYLYMAICICLLLFNLVYFARDFFKRKRDPEMVRKYMNKLCEMLETSGVEKISQKEEKFWTRKLSKSSGLILFQQAVEELEAKGKQEDIEKWVRNNRDLPAHVQIPFSLLSAPGHLKSPASHLPDLRF